MKFLAVLTLASCLTSTYAAEQFGGITFDTSVPSDQIETLKKDVKYLYQKPVFSNDAEFLSVAKLASGKGDHLHNWIINRVRHIVGESFNLESKVTLRPKFSFRFPDSPLPPGLGFNESTAVRTIMTNVGGALYLGGKHSNILLALKLDAGTTSVKSPRVGILQVGEGLFFEGYQINKENPAASANSISRLGTLFHEARHSDGNGISTGFVHDKCPEGHPYAGYAACEKSGNGSYTVGALSERHLLLNCTDCSTKDKTILSSAIADNLDRIVDPKKAASKAALEQKLNTLEVMLEAYRTASWPTQIHIKVQIEIKNLEAQIAELEAQLANFSFKPDQKPALLDDAPEGEFQILTLRDSARIMNQSLK